MSIIYIIGVNSRSIIKFYNVFNVQGVTDYYFGSKFEVENDILSSKFEQKLRFLSNFMKYMWFLIAFNYVFNYLHLQCKGASEPR